MNPSPSSNRLGWKTTSTRFRKIKLTALISISLLATLVQACPRPGNIAPLPGGRIHDISGQPGASPGSAATIHLGGVGVCSKLQIDFGDGTPPVTIADYDFSNPPPLTHVFKWGGKRTVKAEAVEGCFGGAQMILTVPPFAIGYAMPRPTYCDPVPMPPLPMNATVHITTEPNPAARISFGCLGGCVYDANGMNGSATQGYPFPGFRPLSLILRVGGQPFQGGTNVTFTTPLGGPMEVCTNDDNMGDNQGAWGIYVNVDYPGAP